MQPKSLKEVLTRIRLYPFAAEPRMKNMWVA